MTYSLPALPFAFDALEPHIDKKTMAIHYQQHHQAYIDKLNAALAGHQDFARGLTGLAAEKLITNLINIPENIRTAVRNHGGGHVNHSLFWPLMSPDGGGEPSGELAKAIANEFTGFADFKMQFAEAGLKHFGSGWVWLVLQDGKLAIGSTANQDSPLMGAALAGLAGVPLLCLDVWEHAYYLKYQNKRPDYVKAWWNVVNWPEVDKRYKAAII